MPPPESFVRVAVFAPLRTCLDYRLEGSLGPALPGSRVKVQVGRATRLGVIVETVAAPEFAREKIKPVLEVLDTSPLIERDLLGLAAWAAGYYRGAPGEAFETLFPTELRQGGTPRSTVEAHFGLSASGQAALAPEARTGPRQRALLEMLAATPRTRSELQQEGMARLITPLIARGWLAQVDPGTISTAQPTLGPDAFLSLSDAQLAAYQALHPSDAGFGVSLLHGVTGSGKTEIYLHRVRDILNLGRRALVLVPEISLTAQTVARFRGRFGGAVDLVHSGLSDRERARIWERCRQGQTHVLLGTRSAVWMPLPNLGLIIVDEEHDVSYKQQEGFRYSARDVAIMRARRAGIGIILGSATPSLESIANCTRGRYARVDLTERAAGASLPRIDVLDVRGQRLFNGISDALRRAVLDRAARGEQSLLFLNRRGYAPLVVCHACGWIAQCPRCDARLVLHREDERLRCHHCGLERPTRARFKDHPCGTLDDYTSLGVGTEQLEEALPAVFPGLRAVRVDRDAVRRKGQLENAFAKVRAREVDLLIGTQMIAKGHDFSHVTLVGVIDGDGGLLARDFRAEERFVQMILQVAGRAGRAALAGEVLIQSHHPDHPAFTYLRRADYAAFATHALAEREATGMPPSTSLALLRAEAGARELPANFLAAVAQVVRPQAPEVFIAGPVPALMERRGGRFRANLLLAATGRVDLSRALDRLTEAVNQNPLVNRVRWHIDVDPAEIG